MKNTTLDMIQRIRTYEEAMHYYIAKNEQQVAKILLDEIIDYRTELIMKKYCTVR